MSELTADNIFSQIVKLPSSELSRLRRLLDQWEEVEQEPFEPHLVHQEKKGEIPPKLPLDKRIPLIPVPDSAREMQWIADHRREYAGQWVALDGDRLIAHGPNHDEVWAAAQADGAYLPMVTFIEDPDKIYAGF